MKNENKINEWHSEPPKMPQWAITFSQLYQYGLMYWDGQIWKNDGKSDFLAKAVTHWFKLPAPPKF